MEEFFGGVEESRATFIPSVDIKETDNEFVFYCELPGVYQENVDVQLLGDKLIIKGRREFNHEEHREDYVSVERSYGTFQRTFKFDTPVKPEGVKAYFKDGILTITAPKAATYTPKKVPIANA